MAENSLIEWTDHTFNPWTGCTKVSPACDNCYAEGWSKRSGHVQWGPHGARRKTRPANWGKPLVWNRKAKEAGERHKVFCASLADVGDNHRSIAQEWRDELRELVAQTPNLIWLFLTKRPQNIARFYPQWMERWPENVWIGTTVENQTEADRRVPELLRLPAPVRFLSCEPLLGPLRLDRISETDGEPSDGTISGWHIDALEGTAWDDVNGSLDGEYQDELGGASIQWVICGGESGPGARQMHPDWARSLRDQCQDAGVSYFFKQWGDWGPCDHLGDELDGVQFGCFDDAGNWHHPCSEEFANAGREIMFRVSKKAAGRLLDGREWNGVPTR